MFAEEVGAFGFVFLLFGLSEMASSSGMLPTTLFAFTSAQSPTEETNNRNRYAGNLFTDAWPQIPETGPVHFGETGPESSATAGGDQEQFYPAG